jgi:alpha-L-fucosidase
MAAGTAFDWFPQARFGLFMHWGVYSILGDGEWVMYARKIPNEEYARLGSQFAPAHFDADAWAGHAVDAGMRYAVLTSRHHDGFCLWDSQVSEFTSVKTAAKRDFVAAYVKAMRKAGLRVGLYYSLLDWRIPAYWAGPENDPEGWARFIEYVHAQVRELCTGYGKLDVLWFDGCWPYDPPSWRSEELIAMIRKLQPGILINDRTALPGDFDTPENAILPSDRMWESCQTTQTAWGYHRDEKVISLWEVLNKLCTCASKGGNLLLNVGPKPDGTFPEGCVKLLREAGAWLKANGDGIYGSVPVTEPYNYQLATQSRDVLYLHFRWGEKLHWPSWGRYWIPGVKRRVVDVWVPATGEKVPFEWRDGAVGITVPAKYPEPFGTVALRMA